MAGRTEDLATSMPVCYAAGRLQAGAALQRWSDRDALAELEQNARTLAEEGTDDFRACLVGYADRIAQTLALNAAEKRGPTADTVIVDDAPQIEPHNLTRMAVASHMAVCSCGSQAPVVSGDAALIWHAIHRLWPWDSPAMLDSRIRAAIGPGQLHVPDGAVDAEITRQHAEWLRQRWSAAAFTGHGPFSVGETFQSPLGPLPLVPPQWSAMCRECQTSWVPGPWTCPTCGTDNDPDHIRSVSEDPDPVEKFRELRDTTLRPLSIPRDLLGSLPVEQIHLRPRDPDAPDPQPGTPEWDAYIGKGDQVFPPEVLAQADAVLSVRCAGCATVRPIGTADWAATATCPKCGSQIWTNATADTTTDGE